MKRKNQCGAGMTAMLRARLPAGVPGAIVKLEAGIHRRRNDICWGYSTSRRGDARRVPERSLGLAERARRTSGSTVRQPRQIGGYLRGHAKAQVALRDGLTGSL